MRIPSTAQRRNRAAQQVFSQPLSLFTALQACSAILLLNECVENDMLRTMFRCCTALNDWLGGFFERLPQREEADMAFTATCASQTDLDAIAAARQERAKRMYRTGSFQGGRDPAAEAIE
jgi:hypothetical protein